MKYLATRGPEGNIDIKPTLKTPKLILATVYLTPGAVWNIVNSQDPRYIEEQVKRFHEEGWCDIDRILDNK